MCSPGSFTHLDNFIITDDASSVKSVSYTHLNYLADERNLKVSTIDSIHTVLHQILQIAVDDDYIRNNPSDNVLRELKKSHAFQSEKPVSYTHLSYRKEKQFGEYYTTIERRPPEGEPRRLKVCLCRVAPGLISEIPDHLRPFHIDFI